ncbi:MAG TPA: hypothetical protein PKL84_15540, partial [Candidatus Hydrogenedentes bacterium]|nr:hypothetical protein [Candidatus Hydrogenedentota bacterium]
LGATTAAVVRALVVDDDPARVNVRIPEPGLAAFAPHNARLDLDGRGGIRPIEPKSAVRAHVLIVDGGPTASGTLLGDHGRPVARTSRP